MLEFLKLDSRGKSWHYQNFRRAQLHMIARNLHGHGSFWKWFIILCDMTTHSLLFHLKEVTIWLSLWPSEFLSENAIKTLKILKTTKRFPRPVFMVTERWWLQIRELGELWRVWYRHENVSMWTIFTFHVKINSNSLNK